MRRLLVVVLLSCGGERDPAPPKEGASCADSFGGPGGSGYVEACTTAEQKTYWCCNEAATALVCEGKDTLTWHYLKEGCEL